MINSRSTNLLERLHVRILTERFGNLGNLRRLISKRVWLSSAVNLIDVVEIAVGRGKRACARCVTEIAHGRGIEPATLRLLFGGTQSPYGVGQFTSPPAAVTCAARFCR